MYITFREDDVYNLGMHDEKVSHQGNPESADSQHIWRGRRPDTPERQSENSWNELITTYIETNEAMLYIIYEQL